MTQGTRFLVAVGVLLALAVCAPAQSIYATLTGIVSDPSGAVVPNATVKLRNDASGSQRETVSNSDGYFSFSAVPVGDYTYSLTVETKGFQTYKATGIAISGSEKRNINVALQVGSPNQTVEVSGLAESIVPVDSGEKSSTLSAKDLQNFVIVSSNAAEFIKIAPGFAVQNGTRNKANYTGETIGINANGDAGSQSPLNDAYRYNGLPSNSLDITADGAHVSDPGCNCDTPVNPNAEMVAEFKIQSTYSAENQKGPIVISSVTKAGGRDFHGSAFFTARNYALNANDWLFNKNGQSRAENKYYYPGGTFGGPVLIPGTGFNKNRDKLFFFTGFEYYYQVLDTGLLRATVPTPAMAQGNFSPSEVAKLGNVTASGRAPGQVTAYPNGQIPASLLDANMVALMKLYPAANADPNSNGGYNYVQAQTFNQNNRQWMTRGDYNISDNTKLYLRYNYQREVQQFPVGLWWRQSVQVPYPTPVLGKNRSDSLTTSLTHVFSPSMTNEFVFGYTFVGFPNVFQDPSKVDRSKVGYGYQGLFKNSVAQIPSFGGDGSAHEAALVFNPAGFEAGGASAGLYANKYMPSVSDIVTKVVSTHTIKAGFFWEWIRNAQPANNNTNGYLQVSSIVAQNPNTLGNEYADLVTGTLRSYNESSSNRINDISFSSTEFFIQDSWKVNKRLTLDLGMRFSHLTPWTDRVGFGYATFDYARYTGCSAADKADASKYCGFSWNKRDSNIPLGGFASRALYYQPRFGLAFDIFGTGRTVIRGGWGRSYFHSGQFTAGLDASAGVLTYNLPSTINGQPLLAKDISSINFASQAASVAAVDAKDDKQAYTDNYNFTVSQRLPWSALLELSYIGNRSRDIPSQGNGGSLSANSLNVNPIPVGALNANAAIDPNTLGNLADSYRPLQGFSDLYITTHNGYANYNAFQMTVARTKGRYSLNLNYTYGKALGIVGFYDQFNLANNYGVLSGDRRHIFNTAYSVELGKPIRNQIAGAFVNEWQVSGVFQIQSGANLNGFNNQNFNMDVGSTRNALGYTASNSAVLGTTDLQLSPVVTCDPRSGLGANQYINGACFAVPTAIGQNGPTVLPAFYGPSFFNADLALFKSFTIREGKKLQFRVNAYNFLNHPLWSFPSSNNLKLTFDPSSSSANHMNNSIFGITTEKEGHRVMQFTVKFVF